jgi:hypothetical protein
MLAAVFLAAGCGNDDDATTEASAPPPPKAQSNKEISTVVKQFYSGNNPVKCRTLSEAALGSMGGTDGGMDHCLHNDAKATDTPYKIFKITIEGNKATVHLKAGETVSDVILVYENGAWKWDVPAPIYVVL